MRRVTSFLSVLLCLGLLLVQVPSALAAETLEEGSYAVDAKLSCYVSAMGGIEFGAPLLTGATVTVDGEGNASVTLSLSKSQVTIYGVTCDTFVDASQSVPGYYSGGSRRSASYTKSSATALNPDNVAVHYVDSMTFPVTRGTGTYSLYLYINSNVMGVQFGDGSETSYRASLTIDWRSAAKIGETSQQTATVVYNYIVDGTYEVAIPGTITVSKKTGKGSYAVKAQNFDIAEGAYVQVTTENGGTLTCGKENISFTNQLADGKLRASGDTLNGTVTVSQTPKVEGVYTGTLNFVIRYFPGE